MTEPTIATINSSQSTKQQPENDDQQNLSEQSDEYDGASDSSDSENSEDLDQSSDDDDSEINDKSENKNIEYFDETDSSDEEDNRHSIGNIPMKWYQNLKHAGYDLDGKRIEKAPDSDQLDKLVEKMSNPDFWKQIQDPLTNKKQVLTDEEIAMIGSLRKSSTFLGGAIFYIQCRSCDLLILNFSLHLPFPSSKQAPH